MPILQDLTAELGDQASEGNVDYEKLAERLRDVQKTVSRASVDVDATVQGVLREERNLKDRIQAQLVILRQLQQLEQGEGGSLEHVDIALVEACDEILKCIESSKAPSVIRPAADAKTRRDTSEIAGKSDTPLRHRSPMVRVPSGKFDSLPNSSSRKSGRDEYTARPMQPYYSPYVEETNDEEAEPSLTRPLPTPRASATYHDPTVAKNVVPQLKFGSPRPAHEILANSRNSTPNSGRPGSRARLHRKDSNSDRYFQAAKDNIANEK
ncbi:hypothetical protein ADEAN_000365700 [Angomonas deanei]|uniref:Uncharacterized protein n=1 Tax=Angomonas deanei TaxID=59799 RepID=A0A7G2C8T3_9TRYP|nr:hypothetical protein ADEAN_000365700 [Angomonas deanei]